MRAPRIACCSVTSDGALVENRRGIGIHVCSRGAVTGARSAVRASIEEARRTSMVGRSVSIT